jgi:hypothetical protein
MATSVVIPAGSFSVTTPVTVVADNLVESNETVILTLGSNTGAPTGVTASNDATNNATVTITDNDTAILTIAATVQAEEDDVDGEFTISTDRQFDAPVTITFAVTGDATSDADYVSMGTTVVFPAYSDETTIPLNVMADNLVESDETVTISMTTTSNSDVFVDAAPDSSATVTITDDDIATLRVVRSLNVYENVSDGTYWVITDKQFDSDVNVGVSVLGTATAGVDYTAIGTSQLFPAYTDTLTVTVGQLDDSESEINEYIILNLVNTDNARVFIATAPDSTATVTLFDDDMPLISLSQSTTTFNEASGQNVLTATLNKVYFTDVVVNISATVSGTATPTTDFTLASTITVEAGDLTGTTTLTAVQDLLVESDETLTIEILSVVNGVENGTQQVSSTIIDDDIATLSIASTIQAAEDATNGLFTISTDKQFDAPVTVTFNVTGFSTEGTDFLPIGTTIIFPAFSNSLAIPIEVIADDLVEIDESVIINLLSSNNTDVVITTGADSSATMRIDDNDICHLTVRANREAVEGGNDGIFTIYSDKQLGYPAEISLTINGSAEEGTDYQSFGWNITFPAYSDSVNIPVGVIDDRLVEGREDVYIFMQETDAPNVLISAGNDSWSYMNIIDNDFANLSVIAVNDAFEASANGMLAIISDKEIEREVRIDIGLSGTAIEGSDYIPFGHELSYPAHRQTVVFPAHQKRLEIPIIPVSDEIVEGNETVILSLINAQSHNVSIRLYPYDTDTITIIDDDRAVFSIEPGTNGGEGFSNGSFTITSDKSFTQPVTLNLNVSGSATQATDYTAMGNTFIFPASTLTTSLPVIITDDNIVEGNENVTVSITATNNPMSTIDGSASIATMGISDNDFATISIVASNDATEGGANGLFTISVDRPVAYGFIVETKIEGTATEGVDYDSIDTQYNIPANTLSIGIPVTAFSDRTDEEIENIVMQLASISNENVLIATSPADVATVMINDGNPLPGVSILPVQAVENSGTIRFTIGLTEPSGRNVSVNYSVIDIGDAQPVNDYTNVTGTLEFMPGETVKTVEVPIVDDNLDEYDESFQLQLTLPVNAAIAVNNGVGTIIDDDSEPVVRLSFNVNTVLENGGSAYLVATLENPSGKRVAVTLNLSGNALFGQDYSIDEDSLIIEKGALTDSLLVVGLPDDIDELNEQFVVTISDAENASKGNNPQTVLEITDQDQTITFAPLSPVKYGDADFNLAASSTSSLEITYSSSNPSVAFITGETMKVVGVGSAIITASQPGNDVFEPASNVMQTLIVGKAELSIIVKDQSVTYGDALPDLSNENALIVLVSVTGFVNGDDISDIDQKPVLSTTATTESDAGSYPITIGGGADGNYDFSFTNGTLTINKAPQLITFGELSAAKVGDVITLSATTTSGLPVYFESSNELIAQVSGNTATAITTGTATITARQDGNQNYLPAENVGQQWVIARPDGIETMKLNGPLCYPNPFTNMINLNSACKEAIMVELFDINGKRVLHELNPSDKIDGKNLRDGVYLLKVTFENGAILSNQLIKK